jgi:predicted  nucleic acid-binding Zn-ribbon protein
MAASFFESLLGVGATAGGGALAIKWIADAWRDDRAHRRGEHSESVAIKNLTAEVDRMGQRLTEVEKELAAKDAENIALHVEIDEQRRLRRMAEDELDIERRARRDLEHRVEILEKRHD